MRIALRCFAGILGLATVLGLQVSVMVPVRALPQELPRTELQRRMARLVDRVLREGANARLPPHLSAELGISDDGTACAVKQSSYRNEAAVVQTFNVSTKNHDDLVMFVAQATLDGNGRVIGLDDATSYLISPNGRLLKVASILGGKGGVRPITKEDRRQFEVQKQFWLDRLAPRLMP